MKMVVVFLLCCLTGTIYADTELKVVENGGKTQIISIQGDWLHVVGKDGKNKDYLIGDLKQGVVYIVMPSQKKILKMESSTTPVITNGIKAELKDKGIGPSVAGYATREYVLFAGEQVCGSSYISERAAKNKDISNLLATVGDLNIEAMIPDGMGAMVQGMMDSCTKAGMRVMKQTTQLGLPVKVVDEKSKSGYEVVSIDDTVKLDSKIFSLPAGYEHTTPQKMVNDAVQEAMKQISPEQQKMIQDMLKQMGG